MEGVLHHLCPLVEDWHNWGWSTSSELSSAEWQTAGKVSPQSPHTQTSKLQHTHTNTYTTRHRHTPTHTQAVRDRKTQSWTHTHTNAQRHKTQARTHTHKLSEIERHRVGHTVRDININTHKHTYNRSCWQRTASEFYGNVLSENKINYSSVFWLDLDGSLSSGP